MSAFLEQSIEYLKGVGPRKAELFKKEVGVKTYMDLLEYFPFRFEDRRKLYRIQEVKDIATTVQVVGQIVSITEEGEGRKKRLRALLKDDTGDLELVWFSGRDWVRKNIKLQSTYLIQGKPQSFRGQISIAHPEFVLYDKDQLKRELSIRPIYHLTDALKRAGVSNKLIFQLTKQIVFHRDFTAPEWLPQHILEEENLVNLRNALAWIHHPSSTEQINQALKRLKFNELFLLQFKINHYKATRAARLSSYSFEHIGTHFNHFYKDELSFNLTNAQKRVIKEIRRDVQSGAQMNRLVQGDVGSGKTIVAWFAMLIALDNQTQTAFMAPTEILARQHFETLSEYAQNIGVEIAILTGSTKKKEREAILESLQNGSLDILIGTHALIEDPVQFNKLGLAIIDEQHRFGVAQRAKIWTKYNPAPHVLVMTATPIPRTLAMTLYGDLDVSVIDEMPPGRKPTRTIHKYNSKLSEVLLFAEKQIEQGKQVYIVYPLINESEKLDYQDLMSAYDDIARYFPLPKYHIGLVHGQLSAKEKDDEMLRFKKGDTQILMATTVIEVGVNVPNANVMIIVNAERFGLSQLHQLRGRVGRSSTQAYCILLTGDKLSQTGKKRMEAMVSTTNGFELAELDLKLRGPGEIDGTRQSGLVDLKLSSITQDEPLLILVQKCIGRLLSLDMDLEQAQHRALKNHLKAKGLGAQWRRIS